VMRLMDIANLLCDQNVLRGKIKGNLKQMWKNFNKTEDGVNCLKQKLQRYEPESKLIEDFDSDAVGADVDCKSLTKGVFMMPGKFKSETKRFFKIFNITSCNLNDIYDIREVYENYVKLAVAFADGEVANEMKLDTLRIFSDMQDHINENKMECIKRDTFAEEEYSPENETEDTFKA
jgi:hypothetical protein